MKKILSAIILILSLLLFIKITPFTNNTLVNKNSLTSYSSLSKSEKTKVNDLNYISIRTFKDEDSKENINEEKNIKITSEESIEFIYDYLNNNNKYIPKYIILDHIEDDKYIIHCYDMVNNHTSTVGWYSVDKSSGKIENMLFSTKSPL